MYAYIRGTVDEITSESVIIDACGVGYELFCSAQTKKLLTRGQEAKLLTYFHLAQDVVALYGFANAQERIMFKKLISVSRIGPKLALATLSVLTPRDIAGAVYTENNAAFDKVSGMGKKTAARLILELKEKIDDGELNLPGRLQDENETGKDMRMEAVAALVSLGYDGVQAGRAVSAVKEACTRVEEMITLALREIAKGSGR